MLLLVKEVIFRFYEEGFFGYGEKGDFKYFSHFFFNCFAVAILGAPKATPFDDVCGNELFLAFIIYW